MTRPFRDWLKIFGVVTLPLLGFWLYGLTDIDEGFYGAVVAEMNRRSEWITPLYNGRLWFEKPVLLYWAAKPSLALFGGEFGLRLPSVLATLGLYGFVAWFATRRLSGRAAQWSVLILGTSLLVVAVGRMLMTDALLCLCLSGALLTFFESLAGDRRWRLLAAFLLGLSVLAKGPVGCILFILVAAITYGRERELRPAFRGWWFLGAIVFAATVASWTVPAYVADGRVFVQEFLVKQNVERFTGGDAAHTLHGPASWFFYVPVLLLGMLPWIVWLWPAVRGRGPEGSMRRPGSAGTNAASLVGGACFVASGEAHEARPGTMDADAEDGDEGRGTRDQGTRDAVARFLATWAIVVILFFSISSAKLPHYILPAIPPLAILIGAFWARREGSKPARLLPWGPVVVALTVCVLVNAGMVAWDRGMFKGLAPEAEARGLAREARRLLALNPSARVAIYRMGRQSRDMGTGRLQVQETSLPSLLFYLGRDALETDDFRAILGTQRPLFILTRVGRMGPESEIAAKGKLIEVRRTDFFVLWVLEPDAAPSPAGSGHGRSDGNVHAAGAGTPGGVLEFPARS